MADSGTLGPEALLRRQRIAEQLMMQAAKPREIRHWAQGLGQLGEAALAGYEGYRAEQEEKKSRSAAAEQIAAYFAGGQPSPAAPMAVPQPSPPTPSKDTPTVQEVDPSQFNSIDAMASPEGQFDPNRQPMLSSANRAIAKVESDGSGGYSAVGVPTRTGDRAYGKHQVMGANVGPWTKEVTGTAVSPQEFLKNPDLQDAVFNSKFGQYADKFGPVGASKAWFAGEKGMNNPNAKDALGTTVSAYADRFTNAGGANPVALALGNPAPQVATQQAPAPQASPSAPNGMAKIAGLLANPWVDPAIKSAIIAQANPSYGFQTLPDGTMVRTNPKTGQVEPIFQATSKPTWGVIGEDQFGNKQYGWIDTFKKTAEPANPSGGAAAGGASAPVTVADANGKVLTVPPGQDPKKFREHVTTATADAMSGKLTEAQTNATQFANRMEDAERNLKGVEDAPHGLQGIKDSALRGVSDSPYSPVPQGAVNWAVSDKFQKFAQAKSQFITAMLRKESGAAISPSEFNRYDKEFFPQVGDSREVLEQKRHARQVAIEAMKKGAGPVYKTPDAAPQSGPERKSIGGKNYVKQNGQWFEE